MAEIKKEIQALKLDIDQVARGKSVFNQNQVQKLFNSTPRKSRYKRPAKGGGQWDYVKTSYVRQVLNSIFGFNWDFEVETSVAEALDVAQKTGTVVVKGVLIGRTAVDGNWVEIKKTQFGRKEVAFKKDTKDPLDFGNDMKAAGSDALKKCASLLGVAADIYEADEFVEYEIVGSDESNDRKKRAKALTKQAKEAIDAPGEEVVDGK